MDTPAPKCLDDEEESGFENIQKGSMVVEEGITLRIETSKRGADENGTASTTASGLYLYGWKLGIIITSLILGSSSLLWTQQV